MRINKETISEIVAQVRDLTSDYTGEEIGLDYVVQDGVEIYCMVTLYSRYKDDRIWDEDAEEMLWEDDIKLVPWHATLEREFCQAKNISLDDEERIENWYELAKAVAAIRFPE